MILPIVSYGNGILRKSCANLGHDYPGLNSLIASMWETLYAADGSGLAASQVNHPVNLFVVDSKETYERMKPEEKAEFFDGDQGIKEAFINARITEYSGKLWAEDEGCLSIPTLSEEVERTWTITIEYDTPDFQRQVKRFSGTTARVIQHEYDHTRGKLYIDYLNPLKKTLINGKLGKIARGQVKTAYAMI